MSVADLSQILTPPTKRTLSDEVIVRLRAAIVCGQLAPDEPLREAVLAQSMGVSRGPIREALSRLEREGLVVTRSNGRTMVARLSREDLEEVYSLRRALERLAVEYASMRATPGEIAELQAVVDVMDISIQQGISEREAAELDLRFHEILCRASRHQRLLSYWNMLRPQIYVFMLSRNVADPDFRSLTVRGHQELVDAIVARRKDEAIRLIEGHVGFAYQLVRRSYDQSCSDPRPGSAAGSEYQT